MKGAAPIPADLLAVIRHLYPTTRLTADGRYVLVTDLIDELESLRAIASLPSTAERQVTVMIDQNAARERVATMRDLLHQKIAAALKPAASGGMAHQKAENGGCSCGGPWPCGDRRVRQTAPYGGMYVRYGVGTGGLLHSDQRKPAEGESAATDDERAAFEEWVAREWPRNPSVRWTTDAPPVPVREGHNPMIDEWSAYQHAWLARSQREGGK